MTGMRAGTKIRNLAIGIILGLAGLYGYGYLKGSGYLFEQDYEVAKDSTIDLQGSAEDVFMEQYTVMTDAGRKSYGKFFTIYKPTNKGEPENTIIYTIFLETEEDGNLKRLKIIDEKLSELVYKISDDFKHYDYASILDANSTGIVVQVIRQGYEYQIFYPISRDTAKIKTEGIYLLAKDNSLKTPVKDTNGRSAKETVYEIGSNFTYTEPE